MKIKYINFPILQFLFLSTFNKVEQASCLLNKLTKFLQFPLRLTPYSLLLSLCLFASLPLYLFAQSAFSKETDVAIKSIAGKVETNITADDVSWKEIKEGATVKEGTRIRTAKDSTAVIVWNDGNAAKLSPLTLMKIEKAQKDGDKENSILNITKGRLFAKAKKLMTPESSFEVRTPSAFAAVRGSEIAVDIVEDKTNFSVLEGSFAVTMAGAELVLSEGMQLAIPAGAETLPQPAPIPEEKIQELKQEIKDVKISAGIEKAETEKPKPAEKPSEKPVGTTYQSSAPPALDTTTDTVIQETIIQQTVTEEAVRRTIEIPGTGGLEINVK